ncbi:hypothetical protein BLA29_001264 [Euroglyphus maynei]|uniref:Uncharacterized protein n=1 Tax=Euroglyphus maynei TaxID=6958 RepID=A0A1Y3AZH7_EURMA|nr:hypothetical protein BLA29_001264 [Euroglyphus maynei]
MHGVASWEKQHDETKHHEYQKYYKHHSIEYSEINLGLECEQCQTKANYASYQYRIQDYLTLI